MAVRPRALGALARGKASGIAARKAAQSRRSGQAAAIAAPAAGRSSRRGPSSPGRNRRAGRPGSSPAASSRISAAARDRLDRVQPRDDPLDIGVDRPPRARRRRSRRSRRRCRRRCRAARAARPRSSGKPPRRGDLAGAGDQVAGAGVIAEAGPVGEHLLVARRRQRLDRRPARDEALETRLHRGDRGLLQHHLAQPDAIGVGRAARPARDRHGSRRLST